MTYHELYMKHEEKFSDDYEVIIRDIDEGRTDYLVWNYSLREFLFLLHQDCSPEFIKNSSKNVLKALLVRYPHIGYCQGMNYIVTFLLCFCHEETCFWLICYVIEKILPAKFFQKSEKGTGLIGVLSEAFIISSFINNSETLEPDIKQVSCEFLNLKFSNWVLSMFCNTFELETVLYIWDRMLQYSSFVEIDNTILIIINELHPIYLDYTCRNYDTFLLNEMINREVTVEILKKGFGDPKRERITEAVRNKYYTEYFKRFAEKWHKNDHLIHRQLEKITNFSKEEIQLLQTEFLKLLKKKKRKQKNLPEINGITKDDFISIMNIIFKSPNLSKRILINESGGKRREVLEEDGEGDGREIKQEEKEAGGLEGGRRSLGKRGEGGEGVGEVEERQGGEGENEKNLKKEEEDYSKIFDIFDDDKSGSLDFREFLCGMSLLMRGKIAEKIELCFYLFDKENRGFLDFIEFETMMDVFIKSVKVTLPPDRCKLLEEGPSFEEEGEQEQQKRKEAEEMPMDVEKIEEKAGKKEETVVSEKERKEEEGKREEEARRDDIEIGKREVEVRTKEMGKSKKGEEGFRMRMKENFGMKEKLFLSDLLILQNDEFIQELARAYGGILRKGDTSMELGASLDKMS